MTVKSSAPVNDNNWHDIRITRTPKNLHTMFVDTNVFRKSGENGKNRMDLDGKLLIFLGEKVAT